MGMVTADVYKRQVVDDAIVVVEAVQAKFDEGYQSAVLAADDAIKMMVEVSIACLLYTSRCV